MEDHYQALGVPRSATPSIARIAYEGKLKALAKADVSPAERAAEERALEKAYVILSNPAKKDWYDRQGESHTEHAAAREATTHQRGWFAAAAMALVLIAGVGYYFVDRSNARERIRLEEQRIALEREGARVSAEADRLRLQLSDDAQRFQQDAVERDLALRERAYSDSAAFAAQDRAVRNAVVGSVLNSAEQRQKQASEDRERRLAEHEKRQARAEVDRQTAWARQREIEETRIRNERAYRAQREAEIARARDAAERRRTP